MSRTPLMDALRRAYAVARRARASGEPLDERIDREALALSRRRFLQVSAAGAGALMIGGCSTSDDPPALPGGTADIAIIGGGLAGLHCAYRLRQRGVRADVYEASDVLGGRIRTDRTTFPDGMNVELGGELIDTGHTAMRGLASELGIPLVDYATDPVLLAETGLVGDGRLIEEELTRAFAPLAAKIASALAVLKDPAKPISYKDPNGAAALDAMSVAQWLDGARASGPIRKVLEAAYIGEFGLDLEVSNALNFLLQIAGGLGGPFSVFGASDERFHARGGTSSFIEKLASILPDTVFTGTRLAAIVKGSDGRYTLSFESGTSRYDVNVTHVVLALPFTALRDVALDASLKLPDVKMRAIKELGYGTNTKLICGFKSRYWRGLRLGGGELLTDQPFQAAWETSRLQKGDSGILTSFVGGRHAVEIEGGTREEQLAAFLAELEVIVPGATAASNGVVVRSAWSKNPFTKGSYAAYKVGQYTAFAGAEGERVENLHFCGEHTSADAQGFMEGAAKSGAAAATEILQDLGLVAATP